MLRATSHYRTVRKRARDALAQQAERLRRDIDYHNYRYYVIDSPVISDGKFDKLFRSLPELEAAHPKLVTSDSPTQRVGAKPRTEFGIVRYAIPMGSIDNAFQDKEVEAWGRRVQSALGATNVSYTAEPKFDGASVSLRYEVGVLVLAGARGDGTTGEDVRDSPNISAASTRLWKPIATSCSKHLTSALRWLKIFTHSSTRSGTAP